MNTTPTSVSLTPSELFTESLRYWKSTLLYQLLFSLIYFSVFFLVWYLAAEKFGVMQDMLRLSTIKSIPEMQAEVQKLSALPAYQNLSLTMIFTTAFLFPLNVGLLLIFRKVDKKEAVSFQDVLSGYSGVNFLKYFSYYLFWIFVYQLGMTLLLPGILWVVATLLVTPLMVFQNLRFFEAISRNFTVLGKQPLLLLVAVLLGLLLKYSGLLLCGIGILATFPFWNAVIYVLYQKLLSSGEKSSH